MPPGAPALGVWPDRFLPHLSPHVGQVVRQKLKVGPLFGAVPGWQLLLGSRVVLSLAFARSCSVSSFLGGLRSIVGRRGQNPQPPALLMLLRKAGDPRGRLSL